MAESGSGESQQSEQVCNFFRKPSKNKNIRKRTINEDEDEDSNESSVLQNLKKASKPDSKLYFSTGPSKRDVSAESSAEPEKPFFQFESSKEIQVQHDSRATATLETETDFLRDSRALREKVLKRSEEALKGKSSGDEKLYKGIHGYVDHKAGFRREHTVSSEKAGGSHGPLRASAHIRVTARFDYQPDICKDYKETGYCGYGDSCKFMHDRGDYKSGWQMEKEWEEAEKARKRKLALGGGDSDDEDVGQSDAAGILIFILIALITILLVWAILRPTKPKFILQDATVYAFNISSPNFLTTTFQVTVSSRNPNDKIGIYYDKLDLYATYRNQQITYKTSLPTTYQGHKEVNVWSPYVSGNAVPVAPYNSVTLGQDQASGVIPLTFKIDGRVRWKVGTFISGKYHLYVKCSAFINFGNKQNGISLGNNAVKYQLVQSCSVSV